MTNRLYTFLLLGTLSLCSPSGFALTVEQFSNICDATPGDCSNHPTLQAYVGGALDLLATLDEETEYLSKIYCQEPNALFDVAAIIRFMQDHSEGYAQQNAMLLFVRYFEVNGGCPANE